jgi:hypothetical protein
MMAFCRCRAGVVRWRNERRRTIFVYNGEVVTAATVQWPSPFEPAPRIAMSPPGKLEVFLFWALGIVVMVLSGAVAIYATHFHLWDVH